MTSVPALWYKEQETSCTDIQKIFEAQKRKEEYRKQESLIRMIVWGGSGGGGGGIPRKSLASKMGKKSQFPYRKKKTHTSPWAPPRPILSICMVN
ncbi:hypothetical protein M8J76_002512 [Diaphorina citri]|nr:hypothetical protein M8J76_002512 [Diaphorina citri]